MVAYKSFGLTNKQKRTMIKETIKILVETGHPIVREVQLQIQQTYGQSVSEQDIATVMCQICKEGFHSAF